MGFLCFSWFWLDLFFGFYRFLVTRVHVLPASGYSVSSSDHSGEGSGSSQDKPQTLRSSQRLQNDYFSKLFVRASCWGSLEFVPASGLPATVIPLWPTLERVAGAAQKCSQTLWSSKQLQHGSFSKLFVRIFRLGTLGSASVSSLAHAGEGGGSPEMPQTLRSSRAST